MPPSPRPESRIPVATPRTFCFDVENKPWVFPGLGGVLASNVSLASSASAGGSKSPPGTISNGLHGCLGFGTFVDKSLSSNDFDTFTSAPPPSKNHWRKWSFSMSRFRSQMAVSIAAPGWCWKNCCKRSDQHGPTSLDPTWQRAVEATALVQQGDKYARETPHTPSSAFPKAMGAKWAHLGCKVLLENLLSHGTLSQDTICETAPGAPLLP